MIITEEKLFEIGFSKITYSDGSIEFYLDDTFITLSKRIDEWYYLQGFTFDGRSKLLTKVSTIKDLFELVSKGELSDKNVVNIPSIQTDEAFETFMPIRTCNPCDDNCLMNNWNSIPTGSEMECPLCDILVRIT